MCHIRELTGKADISEFLNLPEGAYIKDGLVYGGEPLGVGGAYCSCKRPGHFGFIQFEDAELLKLPNLRKMRLEKESDDV